MRAAQRDEARPSFGNADELLVVEADLDKLRTVVQHQAQEIVKLRAMLMGLVEVVQEKAPCA